MSTSSNPFSTRCIRPGAIPFFFPTGIDTQQLVYRLQASHWLGQIIGPHGSGKSTLLEALIPAVEHVSRRVERFTLNDRQRRLPLESDTHATWDAETVIVIDGYEQLNQWSRWRLRRLIIQSRSGLLVTAHDDIGLPTLFETVINQSLATKIVDSLVGESPITISSAEIAQRLQQCGGNMREVLFSLYDLYEQRRLIT